jgi:putative oxidoreductase
MADYTRSTLLLFARVLLSGIFLMAGTMKVPDWSGTASRMSGEGMTAVPFFLAMAVLVEIGGGLMVLLGCCTRLGALALAAFLVPVTIIFHDFWTYQGAEMQSQMQDFSKNVTIIGGLLALAAAGAGRWSLDGLAGRRAPSMGAGVHQESAGREEVANTIP